MTDWTTRLLGQGRLILTLVAVFVLAGLVAFLQMNRQENPSFPYRAGLITVAFPGAAPHNIERLVLKPLEEEIAEVEQVDIIKSTVRQGLAVVTVQMGDAVYDTDTAWDRVRIAMEKAARDYPDGVGKARLDDRIIDASTVVLAVTGNANPRQLADAAKTLRRHVLGVQGVANTRLYGDPGKQITVAIDDAVISRNGLSPARIAHDIRASNRVSTGGTIRLAGAAVHLKPATEFASLDEVRATSIGLSDGATLPLGAIAHVYESTAQPPHDKLWYNGQRAVGVEVVAARNSTNVVAFGNRLRAAVDAVRDDIAPLQVHEMFYQPAQTERRLTHLTRSLLASIAIILAVLFLFMGWRLGVIVALLLPLVTLTTIALYALSGGVLQQIAVIGMVVALGMLVDNAIVMAENVQWHLNDGAPAHDAAARSIRELAAPLLAATSTTLAAFVPMLLAKGNTADFTRALPITVMLALAVSYVFAITVTPLLGRRFLRARPQTRRGPIQRLANGLASATARRPVVWLIFGVVMIALAMGCMRFVPQEFFPKADRALVLVDITLPEGAHQSSTQAVARQLEQALRARPGVQTIHGFVGTIGPAFYYNLQHSPQAPQKARLVVVTDRLSRNASIIDFVEQYSRNHVPQANVVASILSQGPPTTAPIAVRVFNDDPQRLVDATEQIFRAVLALPGARDVHHDLGTGVPSIDYNIQGAIARSYGVTPADVAQALRGRSQGLDVGEYRGEADPIPIKLRSPEGDRFSPNALATINVYGDTGRQVPLMQVATTRLSVQPGAIRHYNQRRVAHVYSELAEGRVYSQILQPLKMKIADLSLPSGTDIEYGGDAEESGKANAALFTTAPLGIALLLFFLLVQFNSFIRVILVLLTVPFALVGVIPGLLLLGIPFGFQPLLGTIALIGIVVNNAIVLIDVIDQRLAQGAVPTEAIAEAVRRRTRPIIMTTATTIAGLLPLALSDTTLWPPLAWPIITGLFASTMLTLLVLPAVCRLLIKPSPRLVPGALMIVATMAALALPTPPALAATPTIRTVTFAQCLALSRDRAQVVSDRMQAVAAGAAADRVVRAGRYPTLSARAFASHSDTVTEIGNDDFRGEVEGAQNIPEFSVPLEDRDRLGATIELRQPVFDPATQLYGAPAARQQARAAQYTLGRSRLMSMTEAARTYLDALTLRARLQANSELISNLSARDERTGARHTSGRVLESDALEVTYALEQARQQQVELQQNYKVAQAALAQALGINGHVRPAPLDFFEPSVATTEMETLLNTALAQRQDLAAINARIQSSDLKVQKTRALRLPTVDAVASLHYNKGNVIMPESEGRIAAQLTWRPFAGGQLSAQRSEAEAKLASLRAERVELMRSIRVDIRRALAKLHSARKRRDLADLGVKSGRATRKTRSARLAAGRANIDDVLEADEWLAERKANARIAYYDIVDAWVRLQAATGDVSRLAQLAAAHEQP